MRLLADGGNIADAAEGAGVCRDTAYAGRAADPEFAAAWESAIEDSTDRLERVARERALKSSDLLMIFLLKANRPEKYRDNYDVELLARKIAANMSAQSALGLANGHKPVDDKPG